MPKQQKPFLLNGEFPEFLNKLHQQRDHFYQEVAKLSINSDDSNLEKHINEIVWMLPGSTVESHAINDNENIIFS